MTRREFLTLCRIRNGLRHWGWPEDMIPNSDVELLNILREAEENER